MRNNTVFAQKSDEALIDHFQSKQSSEVIEILFYRYQDFVRQTCFRYLRDQQRSEDALMDIFLDLNTKLAQYQIQNFKSWLFFVVRNHCYKMLRQQRFFSPIEEFTEVLSTSEVTSTEPIQPGPIQLGKAISKLKEQQRICIELFYYHELSYAEIAEKVKISIKKVKSHLQNGKRRLRHLMIAAA